MRRVLSSVLTVIFSLSLGRAYAQFDTNSGGSMLDAMSRITIPVPAKPQAGPAAKNGWKIRKTIKPLAPKEWTVMVFINAKNSLEAAGLYNVNEMENVGSTRDLNIVVELGRMRGQESGDTDADGDWTGARRYLIQKDTDTSAVKSPVLMSAHTIDLGNYERARDFVKWAKKYFPAKRYMFIINNHGSGFLDPVSERKGISFDEEFSDNYIRTPQIGLILKEAGKVDVLAFDACLMQMPEVAFEVRDNAEVVVGSEETIPGYGYPYSLFLDAMAKRPGMNAEEAGAVTVETFKQFYDEVKKGTQLSAIRTSKLDGLAAHISGFAKLAQEIGDIDALKAARDGVIRYDAIGPGSDPEMKISFYGDLSQFAQLVGANLTKDHAKVAELRAEASKLQEFIDVELVINNKTSLQNRVGRELSESKGISIYLPPVETRITQTKLEGIFESKYADFAFDKATGWHDFVTFLYGMQ